MRRFFIILLALCMAMICFGCGEEKEVFDEGDREKIVTEATFDDSKEAVRNDRAFELPSMLRRNPVYPRDRVFSIWGNCDQDGGVSATIDGKTFYGMAENGSFEIWLDEFPAGGPYEMVLRNETSFTAVSNILFGDIYICSGQSNMEMMMLSCNYDDIVQSGSNANLRLLKTSVRASAQPLDGFEGGTWLEAAPSIIDSFSAAGYFFGKTLQEELDVPIGLIMSAVGDTSVMPWAPKEVEETIPKAYYAPQTNRMLAVYFNGMIAPYSKLKIKGVLWYQGENQPASYDKSLSEMIRGWRMVFNQNLPFLVVQLPRFALGDDESWYISREMQKKGCELAGNAYYSVNIDCGLYSTDLNTAIHPQDKKPIGERAACLALKELYGWEEVLTSPRYDSFRIRDGKLYVSFENVGSSLEIRNEGKGFEVSYDGKTFTEVSVTLEGDQLTVQLEGDLKAFRYAYGAFPDNCIYNLEGFPCEQFSVTV